MDLKDYITVSEAAELRGVSRQAILELITRGRLQADRAGREWLIRKSELKKFRILPPGRRRGAKMRRY